MDRRGFLGRVAGLFAAVGSGLGLSSARASGGVTFTRVLSDEEFRVLQAPEDQGPQLWGGRQLYWDSEMLVKSAKRAS